MKNIGEFFIVYDYTTGGYVNSAMGVGELAKVVHKRRSDLEDILAKYRRSTKRDKQLIVKNCKGKEFSIICENELGGNR